jgi:hypothetical protein
MIATALLWFVLGPIWAVSHSNSCDPGLATMHYLESDPAVQSKPSHAIYSHESPSPDNGSICLGTTIVYAYYGFDQTAMFDDASNNLEHAGWTPDPGQLSDFHSYAKLRTEYGTITATVRYEMFWVEVWLEAPAAHFGQQAYYASGATLAKSEPSFFEIVTASRQQRAGYTRFDLNTDRR